MEEFDGLFGQAYVELLAQQGMGHAVVVLIDFHVIVPADTGFAPLGIFVSLVR
jgi:hypothetical protein